MIGALSLLLAFSSVENPAPRKVDSSLVRRILSASSADSALPRSSDWTVIGPVEDSAILAVDGTEWRRLPWNNVSSLLGAHPGAPGSGWGNLAPTLPRFLEWGAPPVGGMVSVGIANGHGRYSSSLLDWSTNFEYRYAANRYLSLMGGISYDQILFAPRLRPITGDSLRPAGVGFQAGACGPFVCLELERHLSPILDESWLQPHLDSLIEIHRDGSFWNSGMDSGFSSAWEQRLVLHLGAFQYRARWCSPLWKGAFQSIGLWDLPAGVLRFGTGLEWSSSRAAVRAALAVRPIAWRIRTPGSEGFKLIIEPISVTYGFRALGEFQMTARTAIRFADPFSNSSSP